MLQKTMFRQTISREVSIEGIGVHTGVKSKVTLAPFEDGIALTRTDMHPQSFTLAPQNARPSPLCTLLTNSHGTTLSTVEHLLSALHGMGITDLEIEVEGPEVPIFDGSSLPWVRLLEQAGIMSLDEPIDFLKVTQPVSLELEGRTLAAAPASNFALDCTVDFPHPKIGAQRWQSILTPEVYKADIAPARTFILEDELKQAQAAGFAKGATLEGGVLYLNDGSVANPGGLRFDDEAVRHKMLDVIGDLFLAGKPVLGAFTLDRPGHTVNNMLLRKLV
jgi:UDP-3-O-[3-hydroxymyristoyl] N-acetylglucosamine deacetylase